MPDAELVMTFIAQVLQMPVVWFGAAIGALFLVLFLFIVVTDWIESS